VRRRFLIVPVFDPIDQFPVTVLPGSPGRAIHGKTIVNELPFGLRQIRSVLREYVCIVHTKIRILLALSDFSYRLLEFPERQGQ
jgi:hypothetical protein